MRACVGACEGECVGGCVCGCVRGCVCTCVHACVTASLIVDRKIPYDTLWRIVFWEHTQVRLDRAVD